MAILIDRWRPISTSIYRSYAHGSRMESLNSEPPAGIPIVAESASICCFSRSVRDSSCGTDQGFSYYTYPVWRSIVRRIGTRSLMTTSLMPTSTPSLGPNLVMTRGVTSSPAPTELETSWSWSSWTSRVRCL